jgi:soluble lytic murein transglycosylase-like protein
MALGDCRSVLAGLEQVADRGAAALAAATCHLREAHPDKALEALAGDEPSPLDAYRRLMRAEAALAQGDTAQALAALDQLSLPGASGRRVQLLRGRLRAEQADTAGKPDLEALLSSEEGPEARFWLAQLAGKSQGQPAEVEALRALWLDARPGGWDGKAAERLGQLGSKVPDLDTPAGRTLARKRLDALFAKLRVEEARELADGLAQIEPPPDRAAWVTLGKVRYAARDYASALAAWKKAYGEPASATGSATELFDYALCHARTGDYDTAGVVYRKVFETYPKTKEGDFASFKLGYMEYDRQKCPEAVAFFQEHAKRYPDSNHLDEMLWFTARCAWKKGDRQAASAAWAELEAKRPKSSLVAGAAYWRARIRGLDGDSAGEKAGLETVLSGWPTSGYAWLAAERLATPFPVKPAASAPAWPAAMAEREEIRRAELLLSVGLRRWAQAELSTVPAPSDKEGQLALGWALLEAGDVTAAKKLGCKHAESSWKPGDPVSQQLCTPRPEPAVVERYLKGLDPSIAYGVMVAESNLDPSVTSAVGARGLMQMMPDLGDELHVRLFPDRPYHPDDLYSAPYNAALGSTELSDRAGTLSSVLSPSGVPAVIASYNGGEEAVRRWIGEAQAPPSDEFMEDIGYVETRAYVKRVLGFAMAYRWVYGDQPRR